MSANRGDFPIEQVTEIIKNTIIDKFSDRPNYKQDEVEFWTKELAEVCTSELSKLKKAYKYITHVMIMQRTGGGLNTASCCYWDQNSDGNCVMGWENQDIHVVVDVFGIAV